MAKYSARVDDARSDLYFRPTGPTLSFPRRELGIALVCAGILMMEICLTKVFSIVLWYHFGFLAVSTALLGFASSGVYLSLRPRLSGDAADGPIARAAAIAALMAIASLWLVTQTSFDAYSVWQDRNVGSLLAFVVWVTLPFFFLGLVVSRTLAAFPERANILYGADLVGSAVGCFGAVALMNQNVSGQSMMLLAAAIIALGGSMFAASRVGSQMACLFSLAVPLLLYQFVHVDDFAPLRSPPSKPYYAIESIDELQQQQGKPLLRRMRVGMKDGTDLICEVTDPPTLVGETTVLVETDDGPMHLDLEDVRDIVEPNGEPAKDREVLPWSPHRAWSSLSRVDAFHWPAAYDRWGLWGLSSKFGDDPTNRKPRQKGITIDAWAMTSMMRYSGGPLWPPGTPDVDAERKKVNVLEYLPAGTVHRLFPDGADSIVCIGAGGGLDLMTAKYFGAKKIDGVEINKLVVYAARYVFPDFIGHLYNEEVHPDVKVHIAEGRNFLERSQETYDIVQLSGVDTFSTSEAGAFSLSENYLYTVEGFETFLEHLNDDGIVTLTRWFYPKPILTEDDRDWNDDVPNPCEPRYSLRLLSLAREALERHLDGERDARESIFFLHSENFTVILAKPDGFTSAELETLHQHCDDMGFGILYSPREPTPTFEYSKGDARLHFLQNPLQEFMDLDAEAADEFLAVREFDVSPPVDDKPFFFEHSRFKDIWKKDQFVNVLGGFTAHGTLTILLAEVLLLGFVFVIWPLLRLRRQKSNANGRTKLGILIYFTALGFGFIVVEIVLSQKFVLFLGHPVYALAVILFSMLLFSGIGSMLSYKFPMPWSATLIAGGLSLVPVFVFQDVFEMFLGHDLWVRVAISVALLAPLGLVMGMPFPLGLRVLNRVDPGLIPWAWAINGYTSVLGSVMAVVLAIEIGFMMTIFIAAGVYATGVIGYALMSTRGSASADAGPVVES